MSFCHCHGVRKIVRMRLPQCGAELPGNLRRTSFVHPDMNVRGRKSARSVTGSNTRPGVQRIARFPPPPPLSGNPFPVSYEHGQADARDFKESILEQPVQGKSW